MKKLIAITLLFTVTAYGQQIENFDLVTYTIPTGWKKVNGDNDVAGYAITNNLKGTYCQIAIYKSMGTMGSAQLDFDTDWTDLIAKSYKVTAKPEAVPGASEDGWEVKAGVAPFDFSGGKSVAMLVTMSGYGKRVSIVILTNTEDYQSEIEKFLESVDLKKPEGQQLEQQKNEEAIKQPSITQAVVNGNFAFNTTNFDDGWTATEQVDWVQVIKGNVKILIHYPREGTIFPADPEPLTNAAWNILVAPRYSNLKNYKTSYITTFNRPYLGMGNATENSSGKQVFILLFRQGDSGWIEFVTPDKNSFIQQFKFDPEAIQWDSDTDLLKPLLQMVGYNKFAIAASDFTGTWTSDFNGVQQMYNVYTGNYAGMNIHQSQEEFAFTGNTGYEWKLLVVSGMVGNTKYANVKSSGQFTVVNNWQIHFSKIETSAKTYHAY